MNRHTTSITMDPDLRAQERVRQALQVLRQDAQVTAAAFAQFSNDREVAYQNAVQTWCTDLLDHAARNWGPLPPPTSAYDRRPAEPEVGTELGNG